MSGSAHLVVTRFAPSPTGYLHLGHVCSALEGWRAACEAGGRFLLRLEDIDHTRCRPHFAAAIIKDLGWLGLDWDGPVRRQSEHFADYQAALDRLAVAGLLYPCFCTRRDIQVEIADAGRAPHLAPGGELGASSLRLLAELGYRYDASFQDADHPYLIAPSASTRLAEVPGMQALDDALVYSARHTHARLMKIWREEFDALYDAGCLVPLTLHLRGDMGSTRAARIAALDGLFDYIASRPGVRFMTGAELAQLTLSSGMAPEPDPVAMHQSTLSVTPYRGDLAVKPI